MHSVRFNLNPVLLSVCLALAAGLAPAARAAEGEYRVKPGDTLIISLWNNSSASQEVLVDAEGRATYPPLDPIQVSGLTRAQIEQRFTDGLKAKRYREPRVTVNVKPGAAKQGEIYVLGAVKTPGRYPYSEGMRVMEALGLAGGLLPTADGARASVTRPGEDTTPVDLVRLLSQGEMAQNMVLQAGDTLVVPDREVASPQSITVFVAGQVSRAGPQQLSAGARASDAVAAAGGTTPSAALRKATIAREGKTLPVDLEAVFQRGNRDADPVLQEGDSLLVPEARYRVTLAGEFERPGSYTFKPGDRLSDAVALAGGCRQTGDLRKATLRRGGESIPVDLDAILNRAEMGQNLVLEDDDVLQVPQGAKIYITGPGVARQGFLIANREMTLVEAFIQAGGAAARANLKKATLVRMVDGKPAPRTVDLQAALQKGGEDRTLVMNDGDILYVPSKGSGFNLGTVLSGLHYLLLLTPL
ncbi:MAG: hypothetical protein GX774_00535 [Armatimonadetes bacterium]|jgi:polysaccharide export outer membrane protein|nr:hypothetical protein [Armatimonadota bacterium]